MQILESLNVNDRVRFSGKVEVLWFDDGDGNAAPESVFVLSKISKIR